MINKRQAHVNNPKVGNNYPEHPLSYIVDWVATNLHGWAMSQFPPLQHFSWVAKDEWELIDWQRLGDWSNHGYIIECDLQKTLELHDAQKD